jgi:hypothetical protein
MSTAEAIGTPDSECVTKPSPPCPLVVACMDHPIAQMCDEAGVPDLERFERDVPDAFEQPLLRLWFGPATKPSTDIAMSDVTLLISLPPR